MIKPRSPSAVELAIPLSLLAYDSDILVIAGTFEEIRQQRNATMPTPRSLKDALNASTPVEGCVVASLEADDTLEAQPPSSNYLQSVTPDLQVRFVSARLLSTSPRENIDHNINFIRYQLNHHHH